jgi:hypothetical protein
MLEAVEIHPAAKLIILLDSRNVDIHEDLSVGINSGKYSESCPFKRNSLLTSSGRKIKYIGVISSLNNLDVKVEYTC